MKESLEGGKPRTLAKRLGWFMGLWSASVLALGVLALALRLVFNAIFRH